MEEPQLLPTTFQGSYFYQTMYIAIKLSKFKIVNSQLDFSCVNIGGSLSNFHCAEYMISERLLLVATIRMAK